MSKIDNSPYSLPFVKAGRSGMEITSYTGETYHLENFEPGNVFDSSILIGVIKERLLRKGCSLETEEVGRGFLKIVDRTHGLQLDNFYTGDSKVELWVRFWLTLEDGRANVWK